MEEVNSVQKFYAGKTIFITGASGFMGKVLIEKLLYSFSDVKEIVILMRKKREFTAEERVENFKKLPVSESVKVRDKTRKESQNFRRYFNAS
jgi:alcohol-forming fatty acyl-CoA reductase